MNYFCLNIIWKLVRDKKENFDWFNFYHTNRLDRPLINQFRRTTSLKYTRSTQENSLLLGDDGFQQQGGHTPKNRLTDIYNFGLWSIDTCHNTCHMTILRAQVYSSDRGHVFFWKWPLTKCCFSDCIVGSCQVNLFNIGQDCSEAGRVKS